MDLPWTYPGTIERSATLPNTGRRPPRPLVCPSRSINISNANLPPIPGNPAAP